MATKSRTARFNDTDQNTSVTIAPYVSFTASATSQPVVPVSVNITPSFIPSDTYFSYQWHLKNTGTAGIDINVTRVWDDYKGSGIKIGIIDDGFDLTHKDLAANFDTTSDYDFRYNDATPIYEAGDGHGTAVAGVIGADDNGTGMMGVASDAKMSGLRVSFAADSTFEMFENAMAAARNFDVVNNSWGFVGTFSDNFNQSYMDGIEASMLAAISTGRHGLGTNIVFAAGNSATSGDNTNYHSMQNSAYTITVGAIDSTGKIGYFSTPGASVLVSAPGVAIYTTDNTGNDGFVAGDYVGVSGTSFAAPIVSGVIALMLDANPNLGYRDVQEILAYSSRKIDPTSASWQTNGANDINGTGLHFSHQYGFGLVDAYAAVRLAETWASGQGTYATLDTVTGSSTTLVRIPDATTYAASSISIAQDITIDRIEVTFDISHALSSQLDVILVSPTGTQSVLVDNASVNTLPAFTFDTVADWGESSLGTWTLKVYDRVSGTTGTLNSWSIKFLGDTNTPDDRYIFTDEFAATSKTTYTLTDLGGIDTINAAAVTASVIFDLASHAGNINGRAITLSATTTIENVYTGDGSDAVTGNTANNLINTGRGNDYIFGSAGQDTVYGGAGFDTYIFNGTFNHSLTITSATDITLTSKIGTDSVHLYDIESFMIGTTTYTLDGLKALASPTIAGMSLQGSTFGESISGNNGDDTISGLAGNDFLYGGDGNDALYGGDNIDTLRGNAGNDRLFGEGGTDYLYGGDGHDTLSGGAYNDYLYGDAGNDSVSGDVGTDHIYGGDGNDTLNGGSDNDMIWGGLDHDIIYGGTGDDYAYGDAGDDKIYGEAGIDRIYGDAGNDTLYGGDGNDYLYGGSGNDLLVGGLGSDYMYGEGGNDTFVVDVMDGSVERIFNFDLSGTGQDHLDLSSLLTGYDANDPIANFIKFQTTGADTYVRVNTDGAGNDFVTIARVYGASFTDTAQSYVDSGVLIAEKPLSDA